MIKAPTIAEALEALEAYDNGTAEYAVLWIVRDALKAVALEQAALNVCWHCKVCLEPDGIRPHCEICPTECYETDCETEGCVEL